MLAISVVLGFIGIHVIPWLIYELFIDGYWKFVCYGIENNLINEDIFSKIEEMKKITII
jgi:hypothetical protein